MNLFREWIEKMTPPSSEKFFRMMKEQSLAAEEMARILTSGITEGTLGTSEFTAKAHRQERKVDEFTDRIILSVRHTMIHPIDPDDLRKIAYSLDSTVDTIDHFIWRMEAYDLKATPSMKEMISILDEMVCGLPEIFDLLMMGKYKQVHEKYRHYSDLEESMDSLYHIAVRKIHAGGEKAYTVEDEVIAILEKCSDQCAHVVLDVVVMLERNS